MVFTTGRGGIFNIIYREDRRGQKPFFGHVFMTHSQNRSSFFERIAKMNLRFCVTKGGLAAFIRTHGSAKVLAGGHSLSLASPLTPHSVGQGLVYTVLYISATCLPPPHTVRGMAEFFLHQKTRITSPDICTLRCPLTPYIRKSAGGRVSVCNDSLVDSSTCRIRWCPLFRFKEGAQ